MHGTGVGGNIIIADGSDQRRVSAMATDVPKKIVRFAIAGNDLLRLRPQSRRSLEQVSRTGIVAQRVFVSRSTDQKRITIQRDATTEPVADLAVAC